MEDEELKWSDWRVQLEVAAMVYNIVADQQPVFCLSCQPITRLACLLRGGTPPGFTCIAQHYIAGGACYPVQVVFIPVPELGPSAHRCAWFVLN